MFSKENFIEKLDRFEVTNEHEINKEEIHAIIEECEKDCETHDDSMFLAVIFGFQCGCMKVGEAHE